jgi:hypothetical protein
MGTIAIGDIYGGRSSTQESVNSGGTAKVPTRSDFEVPVLSNIGGFFGISLPVLLAFGVLAFFLIQKYE